MAMLSGNLRSDSLKTKLIIWLIPPVVVILFATGYITYRVSLHFLNIALGRHANVHVMALAHEVNGLLETCKRDLLFVSQTNLDIASMRDFLVGLRKTGGIPYREFSFISQKDKNHLILVAYDGQIVQVQPDSISEMRPNPLLFYEKIAGLKPGEVWISNIIEVEHPFPTASNPNQKLSTRLIYFGTPCVADDGLSGYLMLAIDVRVIRNILSLYNPTRSPIWAFPRSPEIRYSYLFDKEGWVLFQSQDPDKPDAELATDLVRTEFAGSLGRPGMPTAFRPSSAYGHFWRMVGDIREGKHDLITLAEPDLQLFGPKNYFLAYAPITFRPGNHSETIVYGGVAYLDRSRLTVAAGYKQIDVMFIVTLITVVIVAMVIYVLGRMITGPIIRLTEAVNRIQRSGELEQIHIPLSGYETISLQGAINNMIAKMKDQLEQIKIKDRQIESVSLMEKAELEEEVAACLKGPLGSEIPEIVGFGIKIEQLKADILKSAGVDVDVLLIGETGTGKQLTAEAIHNHSNRSGKAFISINCGELDENLLLDTLFGHVKGAFTEAKTDRKGAFLEANGGTLFLDEIQSASLSVQQALLRAVAVRKVKPLGSDREIDVNVRLIAATNADLSVLIDQGRFRRDLYFRLKVITIHTPALREQRENIPVLTIHYLKQIEMLANKKGLGLSKGALEKMKNYDWSGNVRELINVITRAVVMTEGNIIQADDIRLETEEPLQLLTGERSRELTGSATRRNPEVGAAAPSPVAGFPPSVLTGLNVRQQKALGVILRERSITRSRYQEAVGGDLPARTAIYDLQDLVRKGILKRVGQGPATRYVLGELPK
jgi:DNA-binding NtrC family response regulator